MRGFDHLTKQKVAVKRIKNLFLADAHGIDDITHESEMVRKAAHDFVIGFIDMTDDFCGKCLILPLMPKSLLDEMEY